LLVAQGKPGQQFGVALQSAADGASGGRHDQQIGLLGQLKAAIDQNLRELQLHWLAIEAEALQLKTGRACQVIGQAEGVLCHAQAGADGLRADIKCNTQHGSGLS